MASNMNIIFTDDPRNDYGGVPACHLDDPFEYCIWPRIIIHPPNERNQLTAFVNMKYRPSLDWIQEHFENAAKILKGDSIKVINLRFLQWSDGTTGEKGERSTDAYYRCDIVEVSDGNA